MVPSWLNCVKALPPVVFSMIPFLSMGSLFIGCLNSFLLGTQNGSAVDLWKVYPNVAFLHFS